MKQKMALIAALYTGAVLITGSGALFAVYCIIQNIRLSIFNASIPGIVVAMLMLFFGIRSFFAIRKFRETILKDSSRPALGDSRNARPVKSR